MKLKKGKKKKNKGELKSNDFNSKRIGSINHKYNNCMGNLFKQANGRNARKDVGLAGRTGKGKRE